MYKDICIFHERMSEQTFFINRTNLVKREKPVFISVGSDSPPKLLSEPPCDFQTTLDRILGGLIASNYVSFDLSETIPSESVPSTMMSLAGYLLDYSAVYTLISEVSGHADSTNSLGGKELSLVKVCVLDQLQTS